VSVAADVITATLAVVNGLSLSPTPTVAVRKRLMLLDGETPPLVVVSVGDGEQVEQLCTRAGARTFLVSYPVSIGLVFKSLGKTAGNDTLRAWRESVRAALLDWMSGLRSSGLPTVADVTAAGKSVFDPAGVMSQGLDVAEMTFTVTAVE